MLGANFAPGTALRLLRGGQPILTVPADQVANQGNRLRVVLSLAGLAVGPCDVEVTVPGDTVMVLPTAFQIEPATAPLPWVQVIGQNLIRPGQWQAYALALGNTGNVNAYGVPVYLAVPREAEVRVNFDLLLPRDTLGIGLDTMRTWVLVDSLEGRPFHGKVLALVIPIVSPGETGTLNFSIRLPGSATQTGPVDVWAWTSEPIYDSNENFSARPHELHRWTNSQIDCAFGTTLLALSVASVIPTPVEPILLGASCALGFLDIAVRPWVKYAVNGNSGLPAGVIGKVGHFSFATGLAFWGCIPGGRLFADNGFTATERFIIEKGSDRLVKARRRTGGTAWNCFRSFWPNNPIEKYVIQKIRSFDPNQKIGLSGLGGSPWLRTQQAVFPYLITCANDSAATAPAQVVRIEDPIDSVHLDPATIQLGYVQVAERLIAVPSGLREYRTQVDLRPAHNVVLDVDARYVRATGKLVWTLSSLDPATMQPVTDPLAGFLPPNRVAPEGEASVFFTIAPRAGLPDAAVVANTTCIYFDQNPPVCPAAWTNRVDNTAPVSAVQPLAATQPSNTFRVRWSGTDQRSGLAGYSVFYAVNAGAWREWLRDTLATSALFTGVVDSTYRFYCVARDTAGNVEQAPTLADATTLIQALVTAGADETVCANAVPYQLTGFAPAGGTWSGAAGVTPAGLVTPAVLRRGVNVLRYTVTVGGQPVIATKYLDVWAAPAAPTFTAQPLGGGVVLTSSSATGNQWYLNGQPISGATQPTYQVLTAAQAGVYTLTLTSSAGCESAASAGQTITILGTPPGLAALTVHLEPNPTSGRFTVEVVGAAAEPAVLREVRVTDVTGRLVAVWPGVGRTRLEVELPPVAGLYFVQVTTHSGTLTKRLLVMP